MVHRMKISFLTFFLCLVEQFFAGCQAVSDREEEFDVTSVLRAFCQQKHRLDVIECVNYSSQGQALEPWNDCLNPNKDLSKQKVADLACRLLNPDLKPVLNIIGDCVERLVNYSEAAVWMSILKTCARKTDTTSNSDTISGNTVRSA